MGHILPLGSIGKAVVVWLGILVLAVANGLLREALLVPVLGEPGSLILREHKGQSIRVRSCNATSRA
ncbi:hypothetical protein D6C00_04285 [Thiohalobacter thiocyanaticus]|uniref:Uncharacterized protein n=1 Tax=Thiohalobacter thiocyanaticus TaxID=585455 RepID=A0A426QHL9_9GAMM|nr:hypothetical protein D6C00_04285 [Thiohalobacter thiocyanaticus]